MIADMIKNPMKRLLRDMGRPVAVAAAPNRMIDDGRSTNMRDREADFVAIPGMLPPQRGTVLYTLAYAQQMPGDVVEIGSWQGRSTCYFAQACRDVNNGIVRAIDHFKGNVGKEHHYAVDRDDLSDLESNFRRNVAGAGLDGHVKLYNMKSHDAIERHRADFDRVRLLFIDGDHSYEGVTRDVELFAPLLQPGGLIVFDDYHSDGVGVVQAVREHIIDTGDYEGLTQFPGILIARKR
jgi:predicted O-methyltransferase YrrM